MPTYNTYQEAKIANPNSNIIQSNSMGGLFKTLSNGIFIGWNICDPADHCMTVEKFLADGHELVDGDLYLNLDGLVITYKAGTYNSADETGRNKNRHILRAAALEEKPKPTKFVKVEESIFDLKGEFERGELFTKKAWGEYVLIKEDTHLASLYEMQSHENSKIGIYRQVEIDWRDEVKKLDKSAIFHDSGDLFLIIDSNSNDFISMCHEITSLTEKPTN